jgi:hypothetical protein
MAYRGPANGDSPVLQLAIDDIMIALYISKVSCDIMNIDIWSRMSRLQLR